MRRELLKCILLVFTDGSAYYSEYLARTVDDDRRIIGIRGNEPEYISTPLKILERHIPFQRCDDDISVLRYDRTVEDDDISLDNSSILHAITFHPDEECRCRMIDEIIPEVHLRCRMALRSEWESRSHRFEKCISDKFVCREICPILMEKYTSVHESLKESPGSCTIGISEQSSHLIEGLEYSSRSEEIPEGIDLAVVVFVWSHSR